MSPENHAESFGFVVGASDPADVAAAAEQVASGQRRNAFHRQMRAARQGRNPADPIVAGCLEVVGRDGVRDVLGNRWPGVSAIARDVAEDEIKQGLQGNDFYEAREDGSFLIYFGSSDRKTADRQRHAISDAIEARLQSSLPSEAGSLVVDTFVGEVDSSALGGEDDLGEDLFASLRRLKAEAETNLRLYQDRLVRGARVLFQPVRKADSRTIWANRCLLDPTTGGSALRQLESMCDSRAMSKVLAQIDRVMLSRAIDPLHEALVAGHRSLVLLPVQWQTLAGRESRRNFIALLRELPVRHAKHLALEVLGMHATDELPSAADVKRVVSGVATRMFVRHVSLDPASIDNLSRPIEGVSVHMSTLNYSDPQRLQTALKTFVAAAKSRNLTTMACGAASLAALMTAVGSGFDHVCGPAVHYTVDHLKTGEAALSSTLLS